MEENQYYNYDKIDALNATYNLIYGQRGNGKTYGACRKIIKSYVKEGKPSAYIRRLDEMIKPMNIQSLFDPQLPFIEKITENEYNSVIYRSHGYYLAQFQDGVKIKQDNKPFCRTYAINTTETTKGQDAGQVSYVVFDEFITRQFYLTNEFILFQNLLSSIIRNRSGVKIIMLANSVSKYCPYFQEMGLYKVKNQKQGTIDLYTMGKTQTRIAVEYCGESNVSENVSQYYCFENPEIEMITKGSWEISLYRHPPKGLAARQPELEFFIVFDEQVTAGRIYLYEDNPIIIFSPKTTEIKDPDEHIIYFDKTDSPNPLHQTVLNCEHTRGHALILSLLKQHKTYFATNEVGEIINSWLKSMTKGALKV